MIGLKDNITLGVVLNRSPQSYGFDRALWPVLLAYMPEGPGGPLEGPDGPVETTAPLRFPADLVLAFGNPWSSMRVGVNVYYAGGGSRDWEIDDRDQDGLEDSFVIRKQTHLFSTTVGVSGGSIADRVRAEGWVRFSIVSAWHDEQSQIELSPDEPEPTVDRIVALDRDLRIGGGARVHIGNAEEGFVVSPGLEYDHAFGVFRFDDNLVAPDSNAENAQRNVSAHDARLGVGVAWRRDGLLVDGTASLVVRNLRTIDTLDIDGGDIQLTNDSVDLAIPELSIGAEYSILPVLIVRAGVRSTVVGGRTFGTSREAEGDLDDPFENSVVQTIEPSDVAVHFAATGGLGLHVKRFRADAIVGGLFLGGGVNPGFFTRVDLSFDFGPQPSTLPY